MSRFSDCKMIDNFGKVLYGRYKMKKGELVRKVNFFMEGRL
jgi:hypothetical protein